MRRDSSVSPPDPPSDTTAGTRLELELPLGDIKLFRHGATEEILDVLGRNPHLEVSTRHLAELVGYSEKATRKAVDTLQETNLIETRREGNRRLVSIAPDSLTIPNDPYKQIPQSEFRLPARLVVHEILKELDDVLGILLFGSVARGEATIKSDIDLWVLVGDDREQQLHRANQVSKRMSGLQIPPKVAVHRSSISDVEAADLDSYLDIIQNSDSTWSSAPAPDYEILVETPESALNKKEKISDEMFLEGITLEESETFHQVLEEMGHR